MKQWIHTVCCLVPVIGILLFAHPDAQAHDSARKASAPTSGSTSAVQTATKHVPAMKNDREPTKNEPDLRIGTPQVKGSGGPDLYGHYWIDSDEPGGPTFSWNDISGTGTSIVLTDDDSLTVSLPFTFNFYGTDHSSVTIGSNGYVTFGPDGADFSNDDIPNATDPNDYIGPFWDDLNPEDGGTIHYQGSGTEFIVQYTDIPHYSGGGITGTYTFEVILYPDGSILYQYLSMVGADTSATIGIENSDASDGLKVVYDGAYVHDNLAVSIYTGGGDIFWDDFEAYTAGMQLALQNPTDWTTWTNMPGSGEDPFVSNNYAYSGSNTVVIAQNNDLVRMHGQRNSGAWGMSWQMYIPAGKAGYFNTLSDYNQPAGPYYWAMEVYFDAGGAGRLLTGDPQVNFTWTADTWHQVEVIADLDQDSAQFVFDGEIIHEWQWTHGASGGVGPLELDANDLFGATAGDEMYVDDYHFKPDSLRGAGAPAIDVMPADISETIGQDDSVDVTVTVSNVGLSDLSWSAAITSMSAPAKPVVLPAATTGTGYGKQCAPHSRPVPVRNEKKNIGPQIDNGTIVQDGGFEDGTPNSFWNEFSSNFGTPLCDVASCGTGGGTGPHTGSWWAWFGGITSTEEGRVDQDVTIPSGTATLHFWLQIPVANTTGFMDVEIDNNVIFTVTEADAGSYAVYTEVVLDISAYADGGVHNLEFHSITDAGADVLNFFLDDVSIDTAPVGTSWISLVGTTSGTIAPGGSATFDVRLRSSSVDTTYMGTIEITSNDPVTPSVMIPVSLTVSGADFFSDDFEAYTAGMQLALQNPTDWTTWSAMPGSGEDPFVSSNFAYGGSNSVVIAQNNDLVKLHGQRASGSWGISWQVYIPAGKSGYFNTLSDFNQPAGPYYWAMEVYFDAGGAGRLLTGDPQVDFTWTEDTWHQVEVIADLDQDMAQFVFDGDVVYEWMWTHGASGGTGPLELDANDFFGATAGDEMYMDDFTFQPDSLRSTTGVGDPTAEVPVQYDLAQNYPNPFNPSTRITYALPEQASVTLKVYNVLGQEVVTLADQVQEAGYHEVVWNARNTFGQPVGSGVYFYRLEAKGTNGENYTNLKKMLFLK